MKTKTHKSNTEPKLSLDQNLRQQVEKRAYEIWLTSGGDHGDDVTHWLKAENEVLAQNRESSGRASANM